MELHIKTPLQYYLLRQKIEEEQWNEDDKHFYNTHLESYAEIYLQKEMNREALNEEIINLQKQHLDSVSIKTPEAHSEWQNERIQSDQQYCNLLNSEEYKQLYDACLMSNHEELVEHLRKEHLKMETQDFYAYNLNLYIEVFLAKEANRDLVYKNIQNEKEKTAKKEEAKFENAGETAKKGKQGPLIQGKLNFAGNSQNSS